MSNIDVFHRLTEAAIEGIDVAEGWVASVRAARSERFLDLINIDAVAIDNIARAYAVYTVGLAADVLRTWDAHDIIASIRDLKMACPDKNTDFAKEIDRVRFIAKSILEQVGRTHMSRTEP